LPPSAQFLKSLRPAQVMELQRRVQGTSYERSLQVCGTRRQREWGVFLVSLFHTALDSFNWRA